MEPCISKKTAAGDCGGFVLTPNETAQATGLKS